MKLQLEKFGKTLISRELGSEADPYLNASEGVLTYQRECANTSDTFVVYLA